jgi:hypothetical protein
MLSATSVGVNRTRVPGVVTVRAGLLGPDGLHRTGCGAGLARTALLGAAGQYVALSALTQTSTTDGHAQS